MTIELLKKRKKELGLTNRQLADISGVSLGTINKIFSGATKSPQLDTISALTSALGLDSEQYHPESHADMLREAAIAYDVNRDNPHKSNGSYSLEDYYALPDDVRAELIDGYLIYMEAPTVQHQDIIGELFYYIRHYLKTKKGPCKVILSPVDVRLNNDNKTILEPDLIIVCDPQKSDGHRINGAPDLVVEVVSPSSRKRDYLVKLNKYWTAGVREYWIIDPDSSKVSVYQFKGNDDDFKMDIYTFEDKIPVGIYDDLIIDFSEFDLNTPD
jgi:Uma2 family endonuclease